MGAPDQINGTRYYALSQHFLIDLCHSVIPEMRFRASVPIPKFASLRGTLVCELRIKGTLEIYDSSAVFGFKVPTQTRGYNDGNFKSTALARGRRGMASMSAKADQWRPLKTADEFQPGRTA